jgi:glycosyltransferase involved in cell wall biosynthesis
MAEVLTDEALRARLSRGALDRAAELTWSNTATQLMRVVADEVSRRRSRR